MNWLQGTLTIKDQKIKDDSETEREQPWLPIIKASAVVFSEPPHALTHPSQGEVISEPLLSSLDVSSRCAVGLQSGALSSTSRDKSQEQSCLVATEHKKVHDSIEFQVHTSQVVHLSTHTLSNR